MNNKPIHNCPYHIGSGIKPYRCSILEERDGAKSCAYQRYCSDKRRYIETANSTECPLRAERDKKN